MFFVKEFGSSEENDKGDDDTINFSVRSFYLGGALNSAGATWSFASSLQFYMYEVTDNDTFIEDEGFVNTTGSQLPALSKAAFDTSMNEKQETEIFIWGGLDLMRLRPIDDLILLRCTKHKDKLKVKIFPSAQNAEIDFKNPLFKNVAVQSGTIHAARFGHTLTQIPESFMLVGGLSMPNVTKESFDSSNGFQQVHPDPVIYKLHIERKEDEVLPKWSICNRNVAVATRTFHIATLLNGRVILIGSAIFSDDGKIEKRISIKDAASLQVDGDKIKVASLDFSNLDVNVFISNHAAAVSPHPLIPFTGFWWVPAKH